jgi:hypothetical protein
MNNKCGAFPICDSHSSEWKLAINVVAFLVLTNIVQNENEQKCGGILSCDIWMILNENEQ